MAAEDSELVYAEAKDAMDKSLRGLRTDLQKVRTGRASTALLDGIQVDYYGSPPPHTPLTHEHTHASHVRHGGADPTPAAHRGAPQGSGQADPPARRGPQGGRARSAPRCADH